MFYIRRDDPRYCPNCGQRVTPHAAGCSLCGVTLDQQRWQRPPSLLERLAARWRELVAPRRR
jgi:predicted amidophosphoribosyltransferase